MRAAAILFLVIVGSMLVADRPIALWLDAYPGGAIDALAFRMFAALDALLVPREGAFPSATMAGAAAGGYLRETVTNRHPAPAPIE